MNKHQKHLGQGERDYTTLNDEELAEKIDEIGTTVIYLEARIPELIAEADALWKDLEDLEDELDERRLDARAH
jgi:hypothetical protein